jgi:hypothetical protein
MGANAELYTHDFYAWTRATAVLVQAGKWREIDPRPLTEELNDLGVLCFFRRIDLAHLPAGPCSFPRFPSTLLLTDQLFRKQQGHGKV